MKQLGRQELNSLLSSAAIYEQAKAHLIKKGLPVTKFIEDRLSWIYESAAPSVVYFVKRQIRLNH
jgi:hypothetical protein